MRVHSLTRPFGLAFVAALGLAVALAPAATAQRSDRGHQTYQRDYPQSSPRHEWNSHRGHDRDYRGHDYSGAIAGGALLGLGAGALLGRALVAPPPAVYAPRPYYYYNGAPPYYVSPYPPPVYYGR
jgi:hypothetical protein